MIGPIDALTYGQYNGNEITSISESSDAKKGYRTAGGDYSYTDGNMIANPAISTVEYNHLDLPTYIASEEGSITITYDANGNKLKQIESPNGEPATKTVYMGQMEYVDSERASLYHEGGRIMYNVDLPDEANEGLRDYEEWGISDHLGNTRIRYIDKNNDSGITVNRFDETENEISGTYHYYPYGMVMEGNFSVHQGVEEKYQYNGIEHTSVLGPTIGLTMYRVHDASIGVWWQIDPKAEGAYSQTPYNSMFNNPISMSDPDGDFAFLAFAAIGVATNGIINEAKGNSFFDGWAGAALEGALSGGYLSAVGSAVSSHLPSANVSLGGGFNLSISPGFMFGSQGSSIGANVGASYTNGNFSIGASAGGSYGTSNITGKTGFSGLVGGGVSYGSDSFRGSLSTTQYFSGSTSQRTGTIGFDAGKFSLRYENDFHPVATPYLGASDSGDRFRSAAMRVSYGDISAGFTLFTGDPGPVNNRPFRMIDGHETYYAHDGYNPDQYRFGAAYIGYKNYRAGWNSESVRHLIQNRVAHDMMTGGASKHFRRMYSQFPNSFYGGTYQTNKYSLWD